MTYQYSVKKNPRIILLFSITAVLPAAAFSLSFVAGPVIGIIAGIIALLFSYQIGKYALLALRSRIQSHDDGLTITMPDGEMIRFGWTEISHSGTARFSNDRLAAFVYAETKDIFVEILPIYHNFNGFLAELKEKCPYSEYQPVHSATIKELLEHILNGNPL